jgi:hypothetical protein
VTDEQRAERYRLQHLAAQKRYLLTKKGKASRKRWFARRKIERRRQRVA